jgi:tetrahydromethanopterin S-methyltransferase subunit G
MSEEPTQHLPQDGVSQILARLDSIDSRLSNVEGRLSALGDKVERRLQDTRPIWEQVLVRLEAVEGQLVSFGVRLDDFEKRLDSFEEELRSGLRRFGEQVQMLAEDVFDVRAAQRGLRKRMDVIESKAT